jgi:hypothetical protein
MSDQDNREIGETVSRALLDAAGPTGAISVSFRIFPDHVEVDVLKSGAQIAAASGLDALTSLLRATDGLRSGGFQDTGQQDTGPLRDNTGPLQDTGQLPAIVSDADPGRPATESFADWMSGMLRREGLTMEVAARQLGVSVKTVSRWVGGATEPRLRDLRRIHELFGEIPFP